MKTITINALHVVINKEIVIKEIYVHFAWFVNQERNQEMVQNHIKGLTESHVKRVGQK